MLERGFVLFPLEEVAWEWCDPIENESIKAYIAKLPLKDVDAMIWLGRLS